MPISRCPACPATRSSRPSSQLLQTTLIRVGNDEYARDNGAYGLTTLRNRHARVSGAEITFVFTGKSGVQHEVHAHDRRVARVLRECQEIPGQRLFQYLDDDGAPRRSHSHDVNDYLREAADADITAKDFRTWVATVAAARARSHRGADLRTRGTGGGQRGHRGGGRRPRQHPHGLPRRSYVHPRVLETFASGALRDPGRARHPVGPASPSTSAGPRLSSTRVDSRDDRRHAHCAAPAEQQGHDCGRGRTGSTLTMTVASSSALARVTQSLGDDERLDALAGPLGDAVRCTLGGQPLKDVLSGTWLGHPLHPLLTDLPIGFWTSAFTLDLLGGRHSRRAATRLVAWGVLSAIPTAASGAADWGDTTGAAPTRRPRARGRELDRSRALRRLVGRTPARGHARGVALGLAGATAATVGGYLGGHLLQSLGIGVDHTTAVRPPSEWARVADLADVSDEPRGSSPVRRRWCCSTTACGSWRSTPAAPTAVRPWTRARSPTAASRARGMAASSASTTARWCRARPPSAFRPTRPSSLMARSKSRAR